MCGGGGGCEGCPHARHSGQAAADASADGHGGRARARRELELAVRDSLQQEPDAVRNESAVVEEKLTQMTSKVLPGGIAYVSPWPCRLS